MVYIDNNFDHNDPLAKKYLLYNGIYYDIGTKVKLKGRGGPAIAKFVGWNSHTGQAFELCGEGNLGNQKYYNSGANIYIIEILDPVYVNLSEHTVKEKSDNRECPPEWDVEMAWIWYVFIMVIAVIFKERWLIWTVVSAIFFGWKYGFLNGGKK